MRFYLSFFYVWVFALIAAGEGVSYFMTLFPLVSMIYVMTHFRNRI